MDRLAAFLDKRFMSFDVWRHDISDFDLLQWGRRSRFTGIVIDRDVVVLDWKRLGSFRVRLANLATVTGKAVVLRRNPEYGAPYEVEYLRDYLAENEDNPFGVWNAMKAAGSVLRPSDLTQVPPLTYSKNGQRRALDEMREKALPGDSVFTYDRKSGLASLIRRYDWAMWSHVAMFTANGDLCEVTTGGVVRSPFGRLCDESLDVGLYRLKQELSDDQRVRIAGSMERLVGTKGYPWMRVLRIALNKNLGIPLKRRQDEVTNAELMYANTFRLVCYA